MDEQTRTISTRSWCSERMRSVFADTLPAELEQLGRELLKTRKVLDFLVQPGYVSARVQQDGLRAQRVTLGFQTVSDPVWEQVFYNLSTKAYFLARMLAGDFPDELEHVFGVSGGALFPLSAQQVPIQVDGDTTTEITAPVSAVLLRFLELLDQEPFTLFTILGRGREETIAEIRRLRNLQESEAAQAAQTAHDLPPTEYRSSALHGSIQAYWTMDPVILTLHYNIKADELPASVLRWLDPIPLNGLEEHVDFLLEEAYLRVARLAQSFGIGL